MKKLVTLLAVAVVAGSFLAAGCGKKDAQAQAKDDAASEMASAEKQAAAAQKEGEKTAAEAQKEGAKAADDASKAAGNLLK